MATFAFRFPQLAYDTATREPARYREDGKFYDADGSLVQTSDLNGVPGPIRTGSNGVVAPFIAPVDHGVAVFGDAQPVLIVSDDWILLRQQLPALVATAEKAASDAEAAIQKATPTSYFGIDPEGRLYVAPEPVAGGGTPLLETDGRLAVVFPVNPETQTVTPTTA